MTPWHHPPIWPYRPDTPKQKRQYPRVSAWTLWPMGLTPSRPGLPGDPSRFAKKRQQPDFSGSSIGPMGRHSQRQSTYYYAGIRGCCHRNSEQCVRGPRLFYPSVTLLIGRHIWRGCHPSQKTPGPGRTAKPSVAQETARTRDAFLYDET